MRSLHVIGTLIVVAVIIQNIVKKCDFEKCKYTALPLEPSELFAEEFVAPTGNFVALTYGSTHFVAVGPASAELVIIVHGLSSDNQWFAEITKEISKDRRVIIFDLYGSGWSATPCNVKYDDRLFVTQLSDLILALNITQKFHLVGMSLGGAIAIKFASLYQHKINTLSLLAPAGLPFQLPVLSKFVHIPTISDILYRIIGPQIIKNRVPIAFAEPEKFQERISKTIKLYEYYFKYNPEYPRGILEILREFPLTGLEKEFEIVGTHEYPVLMIWGLNDTTVPYNVSFHAKKLIPRSVLKTFNNVGHALTFTIPKEIVMELTAIFSRQ